jgi:hypothetical protein
VRLERVGEAARCARAVVAPVRKEDLGHRLLRRVDA